MTDDKNHEGETVLHVATVAGYLDIAKLLVENNSKLLGKTDLEDETVFHIAAREGKYDVINELLNMKGMDPSMKKELLNKKFNKSGYTALMVAIEYENKEIVR